MQLLNVISGMMRTVEWLPYLHAFGAPENATERSPGIPSHHLQTAPIPTMAKLRRGRGAEVLLCAYKWSSILQATKPHLFICGKFTARSTTTKCSSAGLLKAPSSFAMLSALPLAKETLLHLRRSVPSHWLCPMPLFNRSIGGNCAQASALAPLGDVCSRPRLRGIGFLRLALMPRPPAPRAARLQV